MDRQTDGGTGKTSNVAYRKPHNNSLVSLLSQSIRCYHNKLVQMFFHSCCSPNNSLFLPLLRCLASREGIVVVGVRMCVCVCVRPAAIACHNAASVSAVKVMRCIQCSLVGNCYWYWSMYVITGLAIWKQHLLHFISICLLHFFQKLMHICLCKFDSAIASL